MHVLSSAKFYKKVTTLHVCVCVHNPGTPSHVSIGITPVKGKEAIIPEVNTSEFPGFDNLRVVGRSSAKNKAGTKRDNSKPLVRVTDVEKGMQHIQATDPTLHEGATVELKKLKNGWLMPDIGELAHLY